MVPGCSVRTCASSQARRLPTVSTERWTSRASACATVIGSGLMAPGAAAFAAGGPLGVGRAGRRGGERHAR